MHFYKRNNSYQNGKNVQATKKRAVEQFAAQYNAKQHDKACLKNAPPHPKKLVSTQTNPFM